MQNSTTHKQNKFANNKSQETIL